MTKRLVYCLPSAICEPAFSDFPGIARFIHFFNLYGMWVLPVDRTGTMKTPVRSASLFPMVSYRPFSRTYEELCDERATQVLADAEKLGKTMYVLYSGGIDSTCILVSLLKHATTEQKKNIVVLLSHESIYENPRFFEEHIRGKLRAQSSITFPDLLGSDNYLLSAEHNDMVMGSDKIGKLMVRYGPGSVHGPYDRDLMLEFFAGSLGNDLTLSTFYIDLFERIRAAAPIPIATNLAFLWWINFAFKWQACFHYILMLTTRRHAANITQTYLDSRFISFFNTEEFQLWSMNNLDKRVKDTWKSYKWVAKEIIYDYTKDAEYRDHKTKRGSLIPLIRGRSAYRFLDEHLHLSNNLDLRDYLEPKNDFA